jgi:hypothetical protein
LQELVKAKRIDNDVAFRYALNKALFTPPQKGAGAHV